MKRIHFKKSIVPTIQITNTPTVPYSQENDDSDKKVDVFVQELKEKLSNLNEKSNEVTIPIVNDIIDEVTQPLPKFIDITDEVLSPNENDVIYPDIDEIEQSLDEEIEEHIILTKQSLRVNKPPVTQPVPIPIPIKEEEEYEDVQLSEVNTIALDEKIVANEECLLRISPIAKLPISHILSAHLVFSNPCDGVTHEIIENEDPCSFSLYVKNNRNDDLNVKVCYNVLFNEAINN